MNNRRSTDENREQLPSDLEWRPWVTFSSKKHGKYLTRISMPRIMGWQLAIHIFWRPDGDQDPHDHPFDFWTMPLWNYNEEVYHRTTERIENGVVRAWRWHRRSAEYSHRVTSWEPWAKCLVTVVLLGPVRRRWGFWEKTEDGRVWIHHIKYLAKRDNT